MFPVCATFSSICRTWCNFHHIASDGRSPICTAAPAIPPAPHTLVARFSILHPPLRLLHAPPLPPLRGAFSAPPLCRAPGCPALSTMPHNPRRLTRTREERGSERAMAVVGVIVLQTPTTSTWPIWFALMLRVQVYWWLDLAVDAALRRIRMRGWRCSSRNSSMGSIR